MSIVFMPDLHPGRCLNHRTVYGGTDIRSVRCLEYEGASHVCRFPEVVSVLNVGIWHGSVTTPQPEPWIRPETTA